VLFLARLHSRKRPALFAQAAFALLKNGVRARFAIVGPAEGAEVDVDRVIREARMQGFGDGELRREPAVPPERARDRMKAASVYVLTAEKEPFGMTIIEALSVGVPVVICSDGGLADFVREHECGIVTNDSVDDVAKAIDDLISDPSMAQEMGCRGRDAVNSSYGIDRVARVLDATYRAVVSQAGASGGASP
jgi:glycosyltransferase involved in cell wall biosynthesis